MYEEMIDSCNIIYFVICFFLTGCENEKNCTNQCNGHCSNNLPCNSSNGLCSNGCAPGYVGMFCNTSMYIKTIFYSLKCDLVKLLII